MRRGDSHACARHKLFSRLPQVSTAQPWSPHSERMASFVPGCAANASGHGQAQRRNYGVVDPGGYIRCVPQAYAEEREREREIGVTHCTSENVRGSRERKGDREKARTERIKSHDDSSKIMRTKSRVC